MINEEVSRSSLNLEVRLAKATSKAILDALKKVHKQIEEQGGLKIEKALAVCTTSK
ncbi:hypothetical protein [Clostridioides difficile]|uniref:hypothetical protein n=1 Tax=Clostridioides difficile TaxID=1496 RepID=UPI0002D54CBA|nr:hypothetical protein BER34_003076 [Clostridioides difficile]SHO34408.1 conjugal transfer protein 485339:485824 forward MW:18410 [Clostridioides difficile M120]OMK63661.1 hypothetical protein BER35_000535 [Clostridioides difficile]SJP39267.1 Uncharacterised protein [Clostridioides difficile]SJV27474.1 Uncharacterised protein [Clostridioides difficile]